MLYRQFGKTGLKVSELVFGGGAVGGLLINQPDKIRLEALQRATDAGINWIDTAPSYGNGRSEEALGLLLPQILSSPYVSTKFRLDPETTATIREQIRESLAASLKRLQRSSVTLLQLHNPIGSATRGRMLGVEHILGKDGVVDVLEEIRDEGLIDHFGITALGKTDSIIEVINSGRIDSAQVYYNLLNPSAAGRMPESWPVYDFSGVLDACDANGVAAMNIRVFSAGVIATQERTGREAPLTPGDTVDSETEKAACLFAAIGNDYGSAAITAIRFALTEKRLSCVVFGLAGLAHLDEALRASTAGSLDDDALNRIRQIYAQGV